LRRFTDGASGWAGIPCYAGWVQAHVKSDGAVHACKSCAVAMGNLRDQDFAGIWNGPNFRRFRHDMLSAEGMQAWQADLDCEFCGQLPENQRIHRVYRWFAPVRSVVHSKARG
jgi:radical SAM protein with 4Fe4S-binding SPASM domain